MGERVYEAVVKQHEEGDFTALFPVLPGCATQADTLDGLVKNATDAAQAWVDFKRDRGEQIPEAVYTTLHGELREGLYLRIKVKLDD